MNTLIAVVAMILWSTGIAVAMHFIGFADHVPGSMSDMGSFWQNLWWNLGGAVALLIGLIGNVWIFFLIAKESPWQWGE